MIIKPNTEMKRYATAVLLLLVISRFIQAQSFTDSNLPIVIINTDGGVDIDYGATGTMKIIYRGEGQRNYVSDQYNTTHLNYDGRIDIKIRGNSTFLDPKSQYALTTRKADSITNNNISLLGMAPENDWILNGMSGDEARMRDYLAYHLSRQIGEYASGAQYCELIINGNYKGLYILAEKIKIDNNRVNIIKIGVNDIHLPELSGGYITVADEEGSPRAFPSGWTMVSWDGTPVSYHSVEPKPDEIQESQYDYIYDQFLSLDNTARAGNTSLSNGFPAIIDMPSFIHFMIINELASNADAYWGSTFFHKDRNGKLRAGPVWDFNCAFGNYRSPVNVWQFGGGDNVSYSDNGGSKFWKSLFDNAKFRCYLSKRWNELIQPGQPLNPSSLEAFLDKTALTINEAMIRDFTCWGQWGTPQMYISSIKVFLAERISWITDNLGPYSSCADVPLPPLVITKIHYHPEASVYSSDNDDLEFIEITNNSDKTIDLTGVYFGGTGFVYQFPSNYILGPNKSAFLASNFGCFQSAYGFAPYGQFTRHLSNKSENLVLLDAFGNVIDQVLYVDTIPWPDADGNGYYLELSDINIDNNLASGWKISKAAITQEPFLDVSSATMSLDYEEGSTGTLIIASNRGWTVSSPEAWLTFSPEDSTGNATLTVTVLKNPAANIRNAILTISAAGLPDQTVIITQEGAPNGIGDVESSPVKVYPNPANTILFIAGLSEDTQVSIYDLQGDLILKKQLFINKLDISGFPPGVYTIRLENKGESIIRKLVKY